MQAKVFTAERTALHLAAAKGKTLAGLALVRLGLDINKEDAVGRTAIAVAVASGYKECARALEDEARRLKASGGPGL